MRFQLFLKCHDRFSLLNVTSMSQRNPIDEFQVPNNQPKPRKGRPKRTIIQDSSNQEPKGTTNDDVMSQDSVVGTLKAEGLLMICKLLKSTIDLMQALR